MGKKRLIRALINRAIRDLNNKHQESAEQYFLSSDFPDHVAFAGYPHTLFDVLEEIMALSPLQRLHYGRKLIRRLEQY